MRYVQLILLFFLTAVSAYELSFEKVIYQFEDVNEIKKIYNEFIDVFSDFYDDYFIMYSADEQCPEIQNLTMHLIIMLKYRFKQIRVVLDDEKFKTFNDELLPDIVKSYLAKIDSIYDSTVSLMDRMTIEDGEETTNHIPILIHAVFNNTGSYDSVTEELLYGLYKNIFSSISHDEPLHFLPLLQNYYSSESNMRLCKNLELIQNQIYYLYLRLITSEIIGISTVADAHWLRILTVGGDIQLNSIKTSMEHAMKRIGHYTKAVRKTMEKFSPTCDCEPVSTIPIMTNNTGIYGHFYPITSNKQILFHTNATKSICIHLATSGYSKYIVFDICFGMFSNTHNIIKKNKRVIKLVPIDKSNQFSTDKLNYFIIKWSENKLIGQYLKYLPDLSPDQDLDKLDKISLDSLDASLSQITHFTVTSPFEDANVEWNIINVFPSLTGPSHLVEQVKECFCSNKTIINDRNIRPTDVYNVSFTDVLSYPSSFFRSGCSDQPNPQP